MEQMHHFLNWVSTIAAGMAGPVILSRGSEAQKKEYLLRIASGEIEFVLGYSEPDAGSDMASLL
jgi:alkylation response protein AidB-like acyl-CoA dehydrogenase